jgi:PAS domain S-box-containing protein
MTGPASVLYLGHADEPETLHPFDGDVIVSIARTGDAALARLRTGAVDCLVVDARRPDVDLESFLATVDRQAPDVPVLLRIDEHADVATVPDAHYDGVLPSVSAAERRSRVRDALEDGNSTVEPERNPGIVERGTWNRRATAPGGDGGAIAPRSILTTLLDGATEPGFVLDPEFRLAYWNDRFASVTGYDGDVLSEVAPLQDLFVDGSDLRDRLVGAIESGPVTTNAVLETSDGDEVLFSFTADGAAGPDGDRYVCVVGRDVRPRQRREAELRRERDLTRRILEASPVGIAVVEDDRITRANEHAEDVLGLSRATDPERVYEQWNGRLYDADGDPFSPDDHPIQRVLASGDSVIGFEHGVESPDGPDRWLLVNARPLRYGDDEAGPAVVVVFKDVTSLKEHERELERQQAELDAAIDELERSNAELEQFAYVASHDLREPLRTVSNYLGLLERRYGDELDDDAQDFVEYAVDGAQRMRRFIEDLLKYSRVGREDGERTRVDLNDAVSGVLTELDGRISAADATVTVEDLPAVVGHEHRLEQLFRNLLSNAIKYAGDDPPSIEIRSTVEPAADRCRIAVADDGVGIGEQERERIFDLFYTTGEDDSTGIGLALCKKIVEHHGGEIRIDSTPGVGTTVAFTLPLADHDGADPGEQELRGGRSLDRAGGDRRVDRSSAFEPRSSPGEPPR